MKLIFAGGGTGGHLLVGLSVAEEVKRRFPDARILFFVTGKEIESRCVLKSGFEPIPLDVRPMKGSVTHFPGFVLGQLRAVLRSLRIIKQFKPDMVIGLGGYCSVPPLLATLPLGVPYVLLEQNVVPGRANRLMSRWARAVYSHWAQSSRWFTKARAFEATGTPVRSGILNVDREVAARTLNLSASKKTLLVMGGSQGARSINEVIIQCLPELERYFGLSTVQIIHCAGESDYERVKAAYDRKCKVDAFVCGFLDDMGAAYGLADMVICRSGATTIAEVTAVGIPAVFVPYPYATENHQYWNARAIAEKGGGVIVEEAELTPQRLLGVVREVFLRDDGKLLSTKNVSKSLGKPDATAVIAKLISRTVERDRKKARKSLAFPIFITAWARRQ